MKLTHLTDKTLLHDTKALSQQYRHVTSKLLHHLREIEKRRLFSDLGYSSLFDYVVKDLGFSEPSAARRIHASRLLQDVPEIEAKIETGELNLTTLALASQIFKNENIEDPKIKADIIAQIENKTKRECEQTLDRILDPASPPLPKQIKIFLSEENYKKLDDIKAILAHRRLNPDEFFALIFKIAHDHFLTERFKLNSTRSTNSKDPRYIPATLKKAVYERDKVCQKCGGKFALEIDHRKPFSLGGKTALENLRLLCRSCNKRAQIRASL